MGLDFPSFPTENPMSWEPLSILGKQGMLVILKAEKSVTKLALSLPERG